MSKREIIITIDCDDRNCRDCPVLIDPDPMPCYCPIFRGGGFHSDRPQACIDAEANPTAVVL